MTKMHWVFRRTGTFEAATRALICGCLLPSKTKLNTVCCRKGSEAASLLFSTSGNDRSARSVAFPLMDYAVVERIKSCAVSFQLEFSICFVSLAPNINMCVTHLQREAEVNEIFHLRSNKSIGIAQRDASTLTLFFFCLGKDL